MDLIYLMDSKTYKKYRTGDDKMSHKQLIQYINDTFGLRGKVVKIRVQ